MVRKNYPLVYIYWNLQLKKCKLQNKYKHFSKTHSALWEYRFFASPKKDVKKMRETNWCPIVKCGDPEGFVLDPTAQSITDSNRILKLNEVKKITWLPREVYILYAARIECIDWLPQRRVPTFSHSEILTTCIFSTNKAQSTAFQMLFLLRGSLAWKCKS